MLLRILLLLLLLLFLPPYMIDRCYGRERWNKTKRYGLFIPHIFLALLLLITAIFEGYGEGADLLRRILLTTTLLWCIPELLLALLLLPTKRMRVGRAYLNIAVLLSASLFLLLGYAFFCGSSKIKVVHTTIEINHLPETFEGYRIAFFSDLHLGTLRYRPQTVERIVDSIQGQHADMIIFGGDLVNYLSEELQPFMSTLSRLHAPDGVLSIMGNHDYLEYYDWPSSSARRADVSLLQDMQQQLGWQLLLNEHVILRRGSDSLVIVGLENEGNRPAFPQEADMPHAIRGLKTVEGAILLQHDPSYWREQVVAKYPFPLMLSGHTHAMQFELFGWSPAAWFYPEWGGTYSDIYSQQQLFVSKGVGEVLLPFRWGAWPEINIITLTKKRPPHS